MGKYEYYLINLNEDMYLDSIMEKFGEFLDVYVTHMGWDGQDAVQLFVDSGLARVFERQDPKYVAGKSGAELTLYAMEKCGMDEEVPTGVTVGFSIPYFIGEMVGYFQVKNGMRYQRIFDAIPYQRMEELARLNQDLFPAEFEEVIKEELACVPYHSYLKERRKLWGFTQAELASRSCVSLRAIQQYEQGAKDIRKASVGAMQRLAMALRCNIEDLI